MRRVSWRFEEAHILERLAGVVSDAEKTTPRLNYDSFSLGRAASTLYHRLESIWRIVNER